MNGVDKIIINKMDVLRSIGNMWKYNDVHTLIECNTEDEFKENITLIFNQQIPGIEVEFQGSPE
jgi:hypothetical protein